MAKKEEYYRLDNIDKHKECLYKILFGMRANGKSYAVKERVIAEAYKEKKCTFGLIRRLDSDAKPELVESYFSDMVPFIKKLTKDEYNYISVFRRRIYLANVDEEMNIKRGICIGVVFALALAERYKSTSYPDMTTLIFEEFITDRLYLKNECTKVLPSLVSTCFRRRQGTVYLIGNTVSRQSPYFFEWGLSNIPKQAQGTIDEYTLNGLDGSVVKIAVEYCAVVDAKPSGMFFGKSAKMIDGGQWETDEYPHLPKDFREYDLNYRLSMIYKDYKFNICLLSDDEITLVYIYPATTFTEQRVLQEEFSTSFFETPTLNKDNRAEVLIANLIANNKVVFANNLCGEDFTNCCRMMIKNPLSLQ